MKTFMKKSISVILAVIMCFGVFGVAGFAASSDALTFVVTDDGNAAVSGCDKDVTGVIAIPAIAVIDGTAYDVVAIDDVAFEDCAKITEISIPEGVTSIGSRAFANCLSLTDVYVPESLLVCQYTAFSGCETLTVHCYSSNYQFFTVYGLNENINIDIIDAEEDSITGGGDAAMTNSIVNMIKRILIMILYFITNGLSSNSKKA